MGQQIGGKGWGRIGKKFECDPKIPMTARVAPFRARLCPCFLMANTYKNEFLDCEEPGQHCCTSPGYGTSFFQGNIMSSHT